MPPAWRRIFRKPGEPVRMTVPRPAARFSVEVPAELLQAMTGNGTIAPRISRDEALQVPAVLRARNLICGSLGTLPIRVHGPDRRVVTDVTYLVPQPDPDIANSVVMAMTVEDLLFEGVAWWRVTKFGWHGYPVEARHVPVGSVHVAQSGSVMPSQMRITPDQPYPVDGQVYIDGVPVPDSEVIRFDSPNPPLLRHAARAIRTCLLLDQAAALYATSPLPLGYFAPREGADPATDDEIQQVLDDWEEARAKRAWGYVNAALEAKTLSWNPEQLQLADQRQHAVLEIARAAGVDPEDLGVSTTSRTYQNGETRRQDLLDFTLGAYVSAIQDRLSMRDVLPRGYVSRIDFGGFLRSDTKTRMETYEIGLRVGAYVEDEIRELENKPDLTPAQRAARRTQPTPAARPEEAPKMTLRHAEPAKFASDTDTTRVTFAGDDIAATFRVNAERRTVSGVAVPWGKVAPSGRARWKFLPGSLHWSSDARVKMNIDHDHGQIVGRGVRLQSTPQGLDSTFKVARGAEGDKALALAEDGVYDGFSIEVTFDGPGDGWTPDPQDESVNLVHSATLRMVALTAEPAFDDARLTAVQASRDNQRGTTMTTSTVANGQPDTAAFNFDGFVTGVAEKMAETHKKLTEDLAESLGESFSAGIKAALEDIHDPQREGPQPVRASRFTVTREAPIYSLDGAGDSLVRDAWYAAREHDHDALERLRKFRMQSEDMAKLSRQAVRFTQTPGLSAQFATVTTSNASQVIPPGYRPDLFVPMLSQGRPMVSSVSQGMISNATPFVVPVFGSFSGASADHVEGTNPTDGSLTLATKTVTPGAISGKLILTREIVDSSNPAIDQIALNAMRESYARQTEGKLYTLLNGSNGAAGTITGDTVPSGAQAATFASTGGTPYAEAALIKGIRARLAKYPFLRFAAPAIALMGSNATTIMATVTDSTGRPLFPSIGATNSAGLGNAITQGWSVDGLPFVPAWAMTGVAAGDSQILILNPLDVWVWESPLLTFRFEEKSGPALIELALFGYFGSHVLRPVGLSGIRIT